MAKVTTFAQLKERKRPTTKSVYIALDNVKADEFNELAAKYHEAEAAWQEKPNDLKLKKAYNEIKTQYDEALANSEDFVVEFVLRSVGRKTFEELQTSNPPTEKQKREAEEEGDDPPLWDPETFTPALLAKAIVEPEMTEEEVYELWNSDEWNFAELMVLFFSALQLNQQRKVVDLGKESGPMLDFA